MKLAYNKNKIRLYATIVGAFALTQFAYMNSNAETRDLKPITAQDAVAIHNGTLTMENGDSDSLLLNHKVLDPNADDDGDGLKNNQELFTYMKDGKKYLYYKSHPLLKDTDGDGIEDSKDPDPLAWNVSDRDAVIFQELIYRDDDYINEVLNPYVPLTLYKDRVMYKLMRNEMGPYWKLEKTWHYSNGFDAGLFTFTNKTFPFLKNESAHILAIRGTSDSKDVANDTKIAMGNWPSQADSAIELADEINRDGYKNVYVTGHSLGGYLSHIFLVRSIGADYETNRYPKDTNKHRNPNIKGVYTFNAPRITSDALGWFNPWTYEYANVNKKIYDTNYSSSNPKYVIKDYATANDPITKLTGAYDNVIKVENSKGGHSSTSFFEHQYTPFFKVGDKKEMDGGGFTDVDPSKVDYDKPTTVEFVDSNGEKVGQKVYSLRENILSSYDFSNDVPEGYYIVDSGARKYGEVNKVTVEKKPIKLTYKFVFDGHVVNEAVVNTKYKTDYNQPKLPELNDPIYEYSLENPIIKIPLDTITQDRTIEVNLLKTERKVKTEIQFKDGKENVGSLNTIERKITDKSEIEFKSMIPEGYELVNPDTKVNSGRLNNIEIKKKTFDVTFNFKNDGNSIVGIDSVVSKVRYGDSALLPNIPNGYEIAGDVDLPSDIKENKSVDINLNKVVYNVTYNFVLDNDTNTSVGQLTNAVKFGENAPKPIVPNGYQLKEGFVAPSNISENKTVNVSVEKKVYDVNISFNENGVNIGNTITQHIKFGEDVTMPEIPEGYVVKSDFKLPVDIESSQDIKIPIVKKTFKVTFKFLENNSPIEGIENKVVTLNYGDKLNMVDIPDGYTLVREETLPEKVISNMDINIEIKKKKDPATEPEKEPEKELEKSKFNVELHYFNEDKEIKTETLEINKGEKPHIPSEIEVDGKKYIVKNNDSYNKDIFGDVVYKIQVNEEQVKPKVKKTVIKFMDGDTELSSYDLTLPEDRIQTVELDNLVNEGYEIVTNPNLVYGEVNKVAIKKKDINIKYIFVNDGSQVKTVDIKTKYKTDYELPQIPKSSDENFVYKLLEPMTKLPVDSLTENKEVTVKLKKEPVVKPGEGNESDNTVGNDPEKEASKLFKVEIKYVYDNDIVKEEIINVENGNKPTISNNVEDSSGNTYIIKPGQEFDNVSADSVINVRVVRDKYNVNIKYYDGSKYVKSESKKIDRNQMVDIPNEIKVGDKTYTVVDSSRYNGLVSGDVDYKVIVKEKDTEKPKPTVPEETTKPVSKVKVIYNFKMGERTVKQIVKVIDEGKSCKVEVPQDILDKYNIKDENVLTQIGDNDKSVDVELELKKVEPEKKEYDVTIKYVYDLDNVLKVETQKVLEGQKPTIDSKLKDLLGNEYYVRQNQNIEPITGNKTIELKVDKSKYNVHIMYELGKDIIKDEIIEINRNETIKIPNEIVINGKTYVIKDTKEGESKDREINVSGDVDVKYQVEEKKVSKNITIDYMLNGKTLKKVNISQNIGDKLAIDYDFIQKLPNEIDDKEHSYSLKGDYDIPTVVNDKDTYKVDLTKSLNSYRVNVEIYLDNERKTTMNIVVESGKEIPVDMFLKLDILKGYRLDPSVVLEPINSTNKDKNIILKFVKEQEEPEKQEEPETSLDKPSDTGVVIPSTSNDAANKDILGTSNDAANKDILGTNNEVDNKDTVSTSRPNKPSRRNKKSYSSKVELPVEEKKVEKEKIVAKNPVEGAIMVSKTMFKNGTNNVVLVNSEKTPDIISSLPLANYLRASLLFTDKKSAPKMTIEEITRLKAKTVYVVGGKNSISRNQVKELRKRGINVIVVDGKDRQDTSIKISKIIIDGKKKELKNSKKDSNRFKKFEDTISDVAYVKSNNLEETLSITPIAMNHELPIVLGFGKNNNVNTLQKEMGKEINIFINKKVVDNNKITDKNIVYSKELILNKKGINNKKETIKTLKDFKENFEVNSDNHVINKILSIYINNSIEK